MLIDQQSRIEGFGSGGASSSSSTEAVRKPGLTGFGSGSTFDAASTSRTSPATGLSGLSSPKFLARKLSDKLGFNNKAGINNRALDIGAEVSKP